MAPSNAPYKISESANKQEISGDGPSEEEISAGLERIRTIALGNGLSQRPVNLCDEVEISGLSRDSPWPS